MSRGEPKKIEGGFILTSRKIIESNIFNKPPLYIKVWLYLLSSAQHSNYRGLERGQLITSIKEIQEAMSWKVGYRKETPTTKQIRSILDYLRFPCERDNEQSMIVTTKVTDGMLINIVNYDYFQTIGNYEGNYEKTTKVTRRESKGHNLYNKNVKNDKNVKNNSRTFVPPTLEELTQFILENNYQVDPEIFMAHYETVGWKVGKNKMKDWRAAVRGWHGRNKKNYSPKNVVDTPSYMDNNGGGLGDYEEVD